MKLVDRFRAGLKISLGTTTNIISISRLAESELTDNGEIVKLFRFTNIEDDSVLSFNGDFITFSKDSSVQPVFRSAPIDGIFDFTLSSSLGTIEIASNRINIQVLVSEFLAINDGVPELILNIMGPVAEFAVLIFIINTVNGTLSQSSSTSKAGIVAHGLSIGINSPSLSEFGMVVDEHDGKFKGRIHVSFGWDHCISSCESHVIKV
mmetsp:Transcript_27798/g.24416  ORF Transcript_27798/g.24416 Transcript_27798/m.24416 type:complete len:207 (-) Transcript_27798:3453-4073(-)